MDSDYASLATAKPTVAIPATTLMAIGTCLGVGANVSVKWFHVSLLVLVQARYVLQWLVSLSALLVRHFVCRAPLRLFGPAGQRRWLLLRGVIYYVLVWSWFGALRLVPVGDATVIKKLEVFILGIAAKFLFGDTLTARWWGSCIVSLFGAVLVLRPPVIFGSGVARHADESEAFAMLGACLNILAAGAGAMISILIKFAPDAHFLEVQHVADLMTGVILSPPLLATFGSFAPLLTLRVERAALVSAFFGFSALCLFTLSYQRGAASRVAVINFVDVPLAYMAQVLLFGTPVRWTAIVGSACIIVSVLVVAMEPRSCSAAKSAGVRQGSLGAAQDA